MAGGTWLKMEQKGAGPGARSSHAITLIGHTAYSFGGEFTPRVPVDSTMYAFDLDTQTWSALDDATGDVPPPRVGMTMAAVGGTVYTFGGRDTKHKELNELYAFDTETRAWTLLSSGAADGNGPPHRSYHSMVADADAGRVYVFGGCGDAGRLNDLWAYDVGAGRWEELPSPGEACRPRGGPGLAVAGGKVWVVCGFSGEELDDVHCYDPATREWAVVETTGGDRPSPQRVLRGGHREARRGVRRRGGPQRPRPPRRRQVLSRGVRARHGDPRVDAAGGRRQGGAGGGAPPGASRVVCVRGGGEGWAAGDARVWRQLADQRPARRHLLLRARS